MLPHTRLQARGKVTLPAFLWGQREGNSPVPRQRGEYLPGAPVRHGDKQRLCGGGAYLGLVFFSRKGLSILVPWPGFLCQNLPNE